MLLSMPLWAGCLLPCTLSAARIRLLDCGPDYALIEYRREATDGVLSRARSVLVGLPLDAEPSLAVETAVGHTEPDRIWSSPSERRQQASGPVLLGCTGFVRTQRVVEIVFAPRYRADGTCEVFDHVIVTDDGYVSLRELGYL